MRVLLEERFVEAVFGANGSLDFRLSWGALGIEGATGREAHEDEREEADHEQKRDEKEEALQEKHRSLVIDSLASEHGSR